MHITIEIQCNRYRMRAPIACQLKIDAILYLKWHFHFGQFVCKGEICVLHN